MVPTDSTFAELSVYNVWMSTLVYAYFRSKRDACRLWAESNLFGEFDL